MDRAGDSSTGGKPCGSNPTDSLRRRVGLDQHVQYVGAAGTVRRRVRWRSDPRAGPQGAISAAHCAAWSFDYEVPADSPSAPCRRKLTPSPATTAARLRRAQGDTPRTR
jgi:hypothetical protein